jgi:eukaryotic-like serine/threonine-protein kinase
MQDQQEDRLGQLVGEYRLVDKLGGGGFGTVYLAEHVHEQAQAAVKVLDIRLSKTGDFKDFINEVRTILLRHPHIVPLLDFGISREDLPYLVMEYAPEGTLRDRHPKGTRVPLPTIVSYVDQLASALQYAHDQRVIHRDVKPENILVRANGTLLVSDFGIAKLLEQSVLLSVPTQAGTPVYMAPEQHLGYPCFASDQYALAVVIYEWICGVRPFQGTTVGLAVQHMNTPPQPLRKHLPRLPEDIERIILKALSKAPEDRFERIQDFADALHKAVLPSPSTIILSSSIEAKNVAPLISAGQQVSGSPPRVKPETVVTVPPSTKAPTFEPAIQPRASTIPSLPAVMKPQEEPDASAVMKPQEEPDASAVQNPISVSAVQNPISVSASTPSPPQRTIKKPNRQNTAPSPVHRFPPKIKILTLAVILLLVLSLGSIAFFALHLGNSTRAIGVITKPNNEQIGISDGTYAFDTGTDRADASLKIQAAAKFAQGDKVGATSLWNQAVRIDTNDAEALIYLENQRILNSGSPYITLVVATLLTGDPSNISEGRDNLQGAYVAQKEYNDGAKLPSGKKLRLLIANAGSKPEYTPEVAQMIVQAVKADASIAGVMGWPYSANAVAAAPILGSAHIPMVSSDASTDKLTGISSYFFRIVPPNIRQAIAGAKYAEQELHAKKVALFVDPNDPYCNTLAAGFTKQFVDLDGNKIIDTETYTRDKDQARLPELLQKALNSNPDLIYFAGYANDLDVLLRNFPPSQPDLQVLGGDSYYQLGAYSPSTPLSHLRFTAFAYPDEWRILGMNESQQPFFSEYSAAFNPANADHHQKPYGFTRADSDTILSYDAIIVLLQGCLNGLALNDPLTPEALQKGLAQITGTKAIQGLSGQISLGSNGDPVNKAVVILYIDQDRHIHMLEKNGVQGCFVVGQCG